MEPTDFDDDDWWTAANYRVILNTMARVRRPGNTAEFDSKLVEIEMMWRAEMVKLLKPSPLLNSQAAACWATTIASEHQRADGAEAVASTSSNAEVKTDHQGDQHEAATRAALKLERAALGDDPWDADSAGHLLPHPEDMIGVPKAPIYRLPPFHLLSRRAHVVLHDNGNPLVETFVRNCRISMRTDRAVLSHVPLPRAEADADLCGRLETFRGAIDDQLKASGARRGGRLLPRPAKMLRSEKAATQERDGESEASSEADEPFVSAMVSLDIPAVAADDVEQEQLARYMWVEPQQATPANNNKAFREAKIMMICRNRLVSTKEWTRSGGLIAARPSGPGVVVLPDGTEFPFSQLRVVTGGAAA